MATNPCSKSVIYPSVREVFVAITEPLEGSIPHLYLDIRGLPTIGLGYLVRTLPEALRLPLRRATGAPASEQEIREEWQRLRAAPELAHLGHRAAARVCRLHLTGEAIERLALERLDAMADDIARRLPALSSMPASAQLAICSMAWAIGTAFVSRGWPRWRAAIDASDYTVAAVECTIRTSDNPGVKPRNALNRRLFLAAARVEQDHLDPSMIHGLG